MYYVIMLIVFLLGLFIGWFLFYDIKDKSMLISYAEIPITSTIRTDIIVKYADKFFVNPKDIMNSEIIINNSEEIRKMYLEYFKIELEG